MMKQVWIFAVIPFSIGFANHAHAEKTMPIEFVGEWCAPNKNGDTTTYTLPSWTEDRKCTEILSIDKWSFVFNLGGEKETYCTPESIRLRHDTAPSGTAYMATVSASCALGDTPNRTSRRTYEFERYKGSIMVKTR